MRENVNHRNYFLNKEVKEEKSDTQVLKDEGMLTDEPFEETLPDSEPKVEDEAEAEAENSYTEEFLYDLNKAEQVKVLKDLGLSKKEVKDLKYEEDRVQAILDLSNEV